MLKLKEYRMKALMSQKELAEKLGTSNVNVGRYENGRREPSISMLIKMAELLNVTIDELVGKVG